jgi:hypothetical protein
MRFLTAIVVAALTLVSVRAQTTTGVLAGTVRDSSGGTIPGARVFAQSGDSRQQTVAGGRGQYRFELPAGSYRVEVELPGFRRTVVEGVIVTSAKEVQRDLTLRVGILTDVLYVLPAGGFAEAVPKADVVAHLRIVRSSGTALVGEERNILEIEHEVVVLTLVKGTQLGVKPGPATFLQDNAGEWIEDGRRHVGQNAPYVPGDEFVTFLSRDSNGRLHEFWGPYLTFRVSGGKVTQKGGPIEGFTNGMTLDSFLQMLRKLV